MDLCKGAWSNCQQLVAEGAVIGRGSACCLPAAYGNKSPLIKAGRRSVVFNAKQAWLKKKEPAFAICSSHPHASQCGVSLSLPHSCRPLIDRWRLFGTHKESIISFDLQVHSKRRSGNSFYLSRAFGWRFQSTSCCTQRMYNELVTEDLAEDIRF